MSSFTTNPKTESYNVYLSFCDEDAGSFAMGIYTALSSEDGIVVFWDDERLGNGDREIPTSSLSVIGDCKIAIIVFSRKYVNSAYCLQELEKITECCQTTAGLIVLPVLFDGLHPSYGSIFGEAFRDFLDRISMEETSKVEDKFMTWVEAISNKAFQYSRSSDLVHWFESEYIKNVVEHVTCAISKRDFSRDFYTASVKSVVQDVIQQLKQSKSPFLLGIWGMPGIGKSTIAQAIYDQIGPYFENKYLLKNMEENDKVSLQRKLLFQFYKLTKIEIPTIGSVSEILKEKLQHKRVLLVLDNVDKEQLKALCEIRDWFGPGSKIIITTTDRHLLKEHGVDHIYPVNELDESESLELFNWCVFSEATTPPEDFVELSRQMVAYSAGLPLALTALGRFLRQKDVLQWKSVLSSLKRFSFPDQEVLEALKTGFDALSDEEKQIFLDIACFFNGMDKNNVLHRLNKSTQSATLHISLLEDKSLLTIDENNKLQVHILLQAMARYIIKGESSNKTDQPKMYDVFLSFRGKDTRAKFVSHLYASLENAAIYTFRDDDKIQRGDRISFSLLRAIGQSRICIVVLSENYANSRWCMLELEKILEVGRTRGMVVVPVFYEIASSEVQHQKGQFGKAFEDLISTISVDESTKSNWRRDLLEISGKAGFSLRDSRNESADIKNISEHVTRLLDRTDLFVAEHPVGVESRVETVIKKLNIQKSEDVLILGIWGMRGTGKTTIAKAVYNQIGSKFERRSFLLNIREFWDTDTNRVSLQQKVLYDVYKTTTFKIRDIESGKSILKERLAQTKVLLVLDDVNELDQLKALCVSRKWFGPGSRIIITTIDMDLLGRGEVDEVYPIETMNECEAVKLFSWHAFKQASPIEDFATHSKDVIDYSGKLPLALEVLGSYLSKCKITEWQNVLEKLKCIPLDQIQKKLRVSFDGLKDVTEKQIFLDIACFFIGMDKEDVIQILNGCGFFADIGIKVLVERALVTVDNKNKIQMHDLLRDMGRQIVYVESPTDPEKRSRLWRHEEVFDILAKRKGTEAVKGLALEFPRKDCLETKAFKKMNKLRLLRLAGVKLKGDFKYLSGDLRWLYWHGFPETYTPSEFQQGSLVAIELKYSKLKQIWNKSQMLENLKILNLSHSLYLTETPDFTYLPNLEKLVLKNCPSLSKISHSIGSLRKLLLINLTDCTGLQTLPRSIYKLKSLETLILSGCSKIDKLEEDLEQMKSLITLNADKIDIRKVPFSIVKLKNIGYIYFHGLKGFPRDVFPSLIRSWMSPSNNVISLVQKSVPMSSLVTLKDLLMLRSLCVECGSHLQLTEVVARMLVVLKDTNCQNFEASASATTTQICNMYTSPLIDDCVGQVCTSGSNNYSKSLLIQMGMKCQVPNIAEDSILQTADGSWNSFLHPCDNNPKWSTFSCKGCSIIFDLPTMKGHSLKSMMLFVVYYSSPDNKTSEDFQGVLIINYTKTTIQVYKRDTLTSIKDEEWQSIISNIEPGNKMGVVLIFGEGFVVEKTTVSLFYNEALNKEMERCHVVEEEDFSGGDNINVPAGNNVTFSGGDNMNVPADKNVTFSGQDENVTEDKHQHEVDEICSASGYDAMKLHKNYAVSGGSDMPTDKKVIICSEDENVSDNKNWDADSRYGCCPVWFPFCFGSLAAILKREVQTFLQGISEEVNG